MAASPVALILGVGPNIGASVAKKFASIGYKVAVASRTGGSASGSEGFLSLKADFTQPDSIPALFEKVEAEFKTAPSVVVYNAAVRTAPPIETEMFSAPIDVVTSDLQVNTISAFAAAKQAVAGWKTLPEASNKTFIYTGNALNVLTLPVPATLNLGMGKCASSFWISLADTLHSSQNMRFFYADERYADGKLKGTAIDGEAHADFYAGLAARQAEVPWHATFVKDKGYVKF